MHTKGTHVQYKLGIEFHLNFKRLDLKNKQYEKLEHCIR